jgi:HTH-type transcriptional regulator / antitoxin HigA
MATKTNFRLQRPQKDSYLALVQEFPLASIRSDSHLHAAQVVMDRLLAKGKLNEGEKLYLDALSDDADMLRHLMSAKGVNQAEVHQATEIPKSTISEILAGKKPFSRQIIRKLAAFFGVDRTVLTANL